MAVTGRTSSFSESRFFELLTAATTPASQAELRRSISGEKYQRILTSGSGASLLPCDATLPRRNTPPRNNSTSAYRFNSATATVVPPNAAETRSQDLHSILQSLQKTNAEIQIWGSLKRKDARPSRMESMREIQKGCVLRASTFASSCSSQYHQYFFRRLHHDPFGSTPPREPGRNRDKIHHHEHSIAPDFQSNPQQTMRGIHVSDVDTEIDSKIFDKENFLSSHGIFGVRFDAFVQIVDRLQLSIDAKCYSSQDFMEKRKDLGEFLRTRLNAAMSNGYFEEICSKFGVNSLIMSNSKQAKTHADHVFDETPQPIAKGDDEDEGKGRQTAEESFNSTDEVVEDCPVQKTPAHFVTLKFFPWEDQIEQAPEVSFVIEMESHNCQPNELLDYCDQVNFLQPYEELKERIGVG